MKKKNLIWIPIALTFLLMFTGCAQIQDMTEEESDLYAAYAAEMISKYNIYQKDGVIAFDTSELDSEEDSQTSGDGDTETASEADEQTTETPDGAVDGGKAGGIEYSKTEPIAPALGLPDGVSLEVTDFELSDYYESGSHFAMNAGDGKTYVIVKLKMMASADTAIDISSRNAEFYLNLGEDAVKQNTTYLDEDLTNFIGTLNAGEAKELVLMFEVSKDKAETLTDLSLLATINSETILLEL